MKHKLLLTLMMFALLLPPIGMAQEPQAPTQDKEITAPERDYKALLQKLPVKDKRDVDDRKAQEESLKKHGATDQYLYERLSEPRFVEVKNETAIPGSYIATLTAEATKNSKEEIKRITSQYRVDVVERWDFETVMLHIRCTADSARLLSEDLSIRRVSQDQLLPPVLPANILIPSKQVQKPARDGSFNKDVRVNGDWALDMIDSRFEAFDNFYNASNNAPNGQTYIFDGGVVAIGDHFGSRLSWLPASDYNLVNAGYPEHGTIVASILASKYIGAAIDHKIISVRSPYATGGATAVVSSINSIKSDALASRPKYSQVNISLLFTPGMPTTLDDAINGLLNADIPVIVATGQFSTDEFPSLPQDYTSYWPQRVPGVIRVGMANATRHRLNLPSSYSAACPSVGHIRHINGSDIFAPAGLEVAAAAPSACYQIGILTANHLNNPTLSVGTSVAAPQVAAVLAMYGSLQTTYWPKTWQMTDAMKSTATPDVMTGLALADANRFLYSMVPGNYCRNSASYAEGVARDSLVTCFGAYTSAQNVVRIRSQQNTIAEPSATITSATNFQTNFVMPSINIDNGPAIVRSYQGASIIGGYGFAYVDNVNPGVFTVDSSGTGYASGQGYFTDKVTGAQTIVNISSSGFNWNPNTHYLTIVVYGTGWRYRTGLGAVQVRFFKNGNAIAGTPPSVSYAGLTGYAGLDQINADNPNTFLPGQGEVEMRVFVDGKEANRTKVRFN